MSKLDAIDNIMHKVVSVGGKRADGYALLANFSTIMNFLLGVVVIISILFRSGSENFLGLSNIFLVRMVVLGASFDAIDGKLARRSNTRPKLGAQFDTAADLFTFGFAPSIMILAMFAEFDVYIAFVISGAYLFTASFRLSRFMMDPTTTKLGYFKGMPSPPAAIYIAAWFVLEEINIAFAAFSIILLSGTMISSLPYTAMRKIETLYQKFYTVFTISLMLLFTYAPDAWMITLGKIWVGYMFYFTVLGPFHAYKTLVKDGHYDNDDIA